MSDPLGLIGSAGGATPRAFGPSGGADRPEDGPGFKELLRQQIAEVNELQRDAREAVEDLATGKRDDVEEVLVATAKADTAFRMLLQVRNKMMDAYEEVKQLRI
jgi:flagellar hook-basal body complex protein FliE